MPIVSRPDSRDGAGGTRLINEDGVVYQLSPSAGRKHRLLGLSWTPLVVLSLRAKVQEFLRGQR